jgi:hypothetical protein
MGEIDKSVFFYLGSGLVLCLWASSIPLFGYFLWKQNLESASTWFAIFAMTFYEVAKLDHAQYSLVGR